VQNNITPAGHLFTVSTRCLHMQQKLEISDNAKLWKTG